MWGKNEQLSESVILDIGTNLHVWWTVQLSYPFVNALLFCTLIFIISHGAWINESTSTQAVYMNTNLCFLQRKYGNRGLLKNTTNSRYLFWMSKMLCDVKL